MFCSYSAGRLATLLSIPILVLGVVAARAADFADQDIAVAGDSAGASRKVATADLNLALPDDQRKLRQRLSVAARRVCLEAGGTTAIQDRSLLRCYDDALRNAWAAVQPRILVASAGSRSVAGSQKRTSDRTQEVASSLGR